MAKKLKELLPSVLKQTNNWKIDLLANWPSVIGNLKTKVTLEKIQDNCLVLSVADACWLQELYLLSPVLLRAINQKLDQPRIKRLRFKQSGIKKTPVAKSDFGNEKKRKRQELKNITISPKEKIALKKIKDKHLAAAMKRFLTRCYQEKD